MAITEFLKKIIKQNFSDKQNNAYWKKSKYYD